MIWHECNRNWTEKHTNNSISIERPKIAKLSAFIIYTNWINDIDIEHVDTYKKIHWFDAEYVRIFYSFQSHTEVIKNVNKKNIFIASFALYVNTIIDILYI